MTHPKSYNHERDFPMEVYQAYRNCLEARDEKAPKLTEFLPMAFKALKAGALLYDYEYYYLYEFNLRLSEDPYFQAQQPAFRLVNKFAYADAQDLSVEMCLDDYNAFTGEKRTPEWFSHGMLPQLTPEELTSTENSESLAEKIFGRMERKDIRTPENTDLLIAHLRTARFYAKLSQLPSSAQTPETQRNTNPAEQVEHKSPPQAIDPLEKKVEEEISKAKNAGEIIVSIRELATTLDKNAPANDESRETINQVTELLKELKGQIGEGEGKISEDQFRRIIKAFRHDFS